MDTRTIVIPEIPSDRKYWFFRTEGGEYYPDFKINNFIALGWDDFCNIDNLKNMTAYDDIDTLKNKFKEHYPNERRFGLAVNQILTFINTMKIGDIVLIPSKNSRDLAIGEITSDARIYTEDADELNDSDDFLDDEDVGYKICKYKKRRDIKWITTIKKNKLDPQLFKLMWARNTITDASSYDMYIDRNLHSIYYKNNKLNVTLHVEQENGISTRSMNALLSNTLAYIDRFNFYEKERELDELEIKMMVESPGVIQYIGGAAALTILLGGFSLFAFGADINFEIAGQKYSINSGGAVSFYKEMNRHEEEMAKIELEKLKSSMGDLKIQPPKELR